MKHLKITTFEKQLHDNWPLVSAWVHHCHVHHYQTHGDQLERLELPKKPCINFSDYVKQAERLDEI